MTHSIGFLPHHLFLIAYLPSAQRQRHWWQAHHGHGIVVRRNAVLPFDAAAVAAVHHHLLPIGAEGHAYGGHQRPAGAGAIAGPAAVHMPRGQAEWAMVAMPPSRQGSPNEGAAAPTFEGVAFIAAHGRAEGPVISLASSPCRPPSPILRPNVLIVQQSRQIVWHQAWHPGLLRSSLQVGQSESAGRQALFGSSRVVLSSNLRAAGDNLAPPGRRVRSWKMLYVGSGAVQITQPTPRPSMTTAVPAWHDRAPRKRRERWLCGMEERSKRMLPSEPSQVAPARRSAKERLPCGTPGASFQAYCWDEYFAAP